MKLYNQRSRSVEPFEPLQEGKVGLYSCGPTVYDHAHIGNLSAYVFADILRRTLSANGFNVRHVMNYTDVDDKTIRRSAEKYPNEDPKTALKNLADTYIEVFLEDMTSIGNDVDVLHFLRATESITAIKQLIERLHTQGFAYIADDGVYFSIEAYKNSGKTYGQLLTLTSSNTSEARIQNDEYDKDSAHDFALWKKQKGSEPAWEFVLDGTSLDGRPGWHIECSAMSESALGLPFDIHTGGVDLIFPHHENEIAQSTAGLSNAVMATFFTHNEHVLVDGHKMAKSAQNFFTLKDIVGQGYDPLAFRLLVLQAHYRSQLSFSFDNLQAAQNRLAGYHSMADLVWQPVDDGVEAGAIEAHQSAILTALASDLSTPEALASLSALQVALETSGVSKPAQPALQAFLLWLDEVFGLQLGQRPDLSDKHKELLAKRSESREAKDWTTSDQLRKQLEEQGVFVRDTPNGHIWWRA